MGGHRGQYNRFPGICLTTEENPGKPQLGNRSGAHSSATSHCFKWGPFPPNKVGRITLPGPLAKPIQIWPESMPKKMRSRIRRPRDLWRDPTGHSSKILGGYHGDRPRVVSSLFSFFILEHFWNSSLSYDCGPQGYMKDANWPSTWKGWRSLAYGLAGPGLIPDKVENFKPRGYEGWSCTIYNR